MEWFMIPILVILGIIIGYNVAMFRIRSKTFGAIRIDRSDPNDGPYLFLEIKQHPDALMNERFVMLEVRNENFISHK